MRCAELITGAWSRVECPFGWHYRTVIEPARRGELTDLSGGLSKDSNVRGGARGLTRSGLRGTSMLAVACDRRAGILQSLYGSGIGRCRHQSIYQVQPLA